MNIEGTYTLQEVPEQVWRNLMDPDVLRLSIPSLDRLEKLDENSYDVTMSIRHTPLRGTYHGLITISEQHYPYHYRLAIEGEGRQEKISGSASIHLNQRGDHTVVAYKVTLNPGRTPPLMPPMLMKGTAKLLIQQFFSLLAERLRTYSVVEISATGAGQYESAVSTGSAVRSGRVGGSVVILPPPPLKPPTLTQKLVRLCGLGAGDAEQEARWETRVRRIGIVAGLLLLLWFGTRLPRLFSKRRATSP